ncbi:unnamed protein product [Peronospora belbahrii]|uniref:Uncharacterized protein n=1 Tax=Peronospora belbahrii TaxID=622444 RepID=A0ABN8D7X7_9STRA|nr:unnamed protein product [Peronospora belbahrii]
MSNTVSIPQQSIKSTGTSGSRKRVFSFQARWLHSLPIIERSLSSTEMNGQVLNKALYRFDNAVSHTPVATSTIESPEKQQDVIVCMLCDDPSSKRELTKIWSRSNCRRGRIENHLMSKHPEFMRLLKHKREAEGDLAVQIFLQNLREGRCNARTEINNGLYGQLNGLGVDHSNPAAVDQDTELPKRAFGEYLNGHDGSESNRKRTKLTECSTNDKDTLDVAESVYSAGSIATVRANEATSANAATVGGVSSFTSSVLYQDEVMSAHWQAVFFNKLVVVIGGENQSMSTIAIQLWLLGANVLLTFTNMSALDDFNTKHIGRFSDPSSSKDSPRGVMIPVLGSFRTQSDISEWCSSVATKYQRVNFLINYVGSEMAELLSSEHTKENLIDSELIVSNVALIEALNESMVSTCFSDRASSENGWLTPSSAVKLQPRNIQVNCVLLPSRQSSNADNVEASDEMAVLSHSILFLLSPLSRLLSGSVLRLQQDTTLSQALAVANRRTDVSSPSTTESADDTTDVHSI